ncbi:TonB-dependent receptor [Flavobacteriaceae bacterium F08102]|nr:TonB-dependent receptor [Flavobacteriaceae bacterium F08102]
MKKTITLVFLLITYLAIAQDKGIIQGKVIDKEMNNEPLPFANVFIKDSQTGTTTNLDGIYSFNADPGTYTMVFSYVGYQKIEVPNIIVKPGEVTTLENVILEAAEGMTLKEVIVKSTVQKESVAALLTDQKKAVSIQTAIGAEELSNLGVSDAAVATTKISGITQSEGSGDVFIRGLGDRYLTTTMNGLPIPSDDVEKKNIDLKLFTTGVIQNIAVTKVFNVDNYADMASGSINVVSKEAKGKNLSLGVGFGTNTNAIDQDVFKRSQNVNDLSFGFYARPMTTQAAITQQSWDTETQSTPLNFNGSFSLNAKIPVFGRNLGVFVRASHANTFEHTQGTFRQFRSNVLNKEFTDAETFNSKTNTTALLNLSLSASDKVKLSWNTLLINKSNDEVYEAGRNLEGYVFDQDPSEFQAFIRDQNTKSTQLAVNQFLGSYKPSEKNVFTWGLGYNFVLSTEPNRIRNEVNTLAPGKIEYSNVGDFQQRKSNQHIQDEEYNAFLKDHWTISQNEDNDNSSSINFGINYRHRERTLASQFIGARARNLTTNSIDNLSEIFTPGQFPSSTLKSLTASYMGSLDIIAPFAAFEFTVNKFSASLGVRYEQINLDLPQWDVPNYVGRTGSLYSAYDNFSPALNIRYAATEKANLRVSFSKTITLPEFKEIAPFEYNDPTGRVTSGNVDLIASTNYNLDLKYEYFPSNRQVLSLGVFYKNIQDPINAAITRGSSGNFSYFNTGEQANVFGVEFESRVDLIKQNEDGEGDQLNLVLNAALMRHTQDLLENFQYANKTESGLQGASDFITNTSLTYSNNKPYSFMASLSAAYASDKIYSLGGPEDKTNSATFYNDEIIEKGYVGVDLQITKELNDHFSFKVSGKNLLNPNIRQTQKVKNFNTEVETTENVLLYKKGMTLNLGINYTF